MKSKLIACVALAALSLVAVVAQAAGVDVPHLVAQFVSPEAAMGLTAASAVLSTKYSHSGMVIDYVNNTGAAIASDAVVKMGNTLGVALVDIADTATGSVGFGVFRDMPKVNGAVIAQGESLTWDVSAGKFDDNLAVPAAGDVTGATCYAAESKGAGTDTIAVHFCGCPGTVT